LTVSGFYLILFFQERSLRDLRRFQPRQPLPGILDFRKIRVGVFPDIKQL